MTRADILARLHELFGESLLGWAVEEPDLEALRIQADEAEALSIQLANIPFDPEQVSFQAEVETLRVAVLAAAAERMEELRTTWTSERTAAGQVRGYVSEVDEGAARYVDDRR